MSLVRDFFIDPEFRRRRDVLAAVALFEGLPERELGFLTRVTLDKEYAPGDVLFAEGDTGRALFVVESGQVELVKRGADGAPQRLAVVGPGTFFGEMALLEELPRSASAVAVERTRVQLLYKAKLDALTEVRPRVGVIVLQRLAMFLSARLRLASEQLVGREASGRRVPA